MESTPIEPVASLIDFATQTSCLFGGSCVVNVRDYLLNDSLKQKVIFVVGLVGIVEKN